MINFISLTKLLERCSIKMPHKLFLLFIAYLCIILISYQTRAQTGTPVLFFSDITSGMNTGGQENLGAFITLYGEGFGATRGNSTVTIGGIEVAKYVIWGQDNGAARSLDMIVVQPGPNITSGNIIVTVNGQASNPLQFIVRIGLIYFVIPDASNANDANPGTYAEPFQTLYRPRQVMQAGDIVYIKGGTFNTADPDHPGWDAILLLSTDTDPNGTADAPIAYIGYPGDRPVLGAPAPMRRGIYMEQTTAYYVIANWEFSQHAGNLSLSGNGHRIVGNYSHDGVAGEDYTVIGIAGNSAHLKLFGNLLRNNPNTGSDEVGVGFYLEGFGTNQDIDFGWNQIQDQNGRRSIQVFGHIAGDRMEDIRIHENLISTSLPLRNNILLGGSDGGTEVLGTIYVFNNIIVGANGQGLRINDPQGTVIIQNNALYNNGSLGYDGNGQLFIEQAGTGKITLQDNILYAESGQTYYDFGTGVDPSVFNTASNNLWFNAGIAPSWDTNSVNANPMFIDAASDDFRLSENSPAINTGINTGIARDYMGTFRDLNYDIGAYEYTVPTSVETDGGQSTLILDFRLTQNYPNPFNPSTKIGWQSPAGSWQTLKMYDILGNEIATLVDEYRAAGKYETEFATANLPSGVYFYRLRAGSFVQTKKMILIK
jgi:hypothetical protein